MPRNQTEKDQWKGGIIIRHETDPTLSAQHQAFVEAYVKNGGNASAAEREVGLPHSSSLLKNHKIREAIEIKRDTDIKTAGATQAWQVMQGLMTDPTAPAQVRFQSARWILEASGHGLSAVAAAIQLGKSGKKDQHEMSLSELADVVDKGRRQLESMRQVVGELKAVDGAIDIKPE
jgi:hypothetical protein